jgi:hypothetical protein
MGIRKINLYAMLDKENEYGQNSLLNTGYVISDKERCLVNEEIIRIKENSYYLMDWEEARNMLIIR